MWRGTRVLVTGGASFIGSHLCDELIKRGAWVRVVDDLSSGKLENVPSATEFVEADLRSPGVARGVLYDVDTVFHLAADHGGRGYCDLHQAGPASNLYLDGVVFWEALQAGVAKVVYASSGCIYPNYLQQSPEDEFYLTEDMAGPPYEADNLYGWAKLMGEMTLRAYAQERGLRAASCRYFTVYGPRGKEDHAIIAMIARAFIGQDPFEVWGDGTQIRNWTYVSDIVDGTILAAEKIDDGTAVNLGTMERIQVVEAARMVCETMRHDCEFQFMPDMPTGPLNRVCDNALAKELLGWQPRYTFEQGLRKTIAWYVQNKDREQVRRELAGRLTER